MIYLTINGDGTKGNLEKPEFDRLPATIQEEFLNTVHIQRVQGDRIYFWTHNSSEMQRLAVRMRDLERARKRSKKRLDDLHSSSEGFHLPDDIEELFIAQEGICYYSGEPLSWSPKKFEIDHIIPVAEGGSSWPANLALCMKGINAEKGALSKQKFFNKLKARYGEDWFRAHRMFVKEVNARRKVIDQRRKRNVSILMETLSQNLSAEFPNFAINYVLEDGQPILRVGLYSVKFPAGFIRQKKKFASFEYLRGIVASILFDGSR